MHTDTVLFQSQDDDELYNLQVREWDPVIQWFCDRYRVNLQKSRNMVAPTIGDDTKMAISKHLLSYNFSAIHGNNIPHSHPPSRCTFLIILGFVYGVDTLKSVILTLACADRFLTPERAVLLSRLEEEFQVRK